MTVLSRLIERRSAGDPFRDAWFGGDDVSAFGALSPSSAARISTVYACWRIVTDSFAALPVDQFRKDGGRRAEVDPAWPIVANPSGLVDRIGWVTQYAMSMLSDGNAFGAVLATDRSGWPTHVEWLSPTAVGVELKGGRKLFRVGDTVYRDDEIVHIPWLIQPGGLRGLSPLGALREWTQAQKGGGEYLAEFFEGGGHPTAILSTSQRIDAAVAGQVKSRFRAVVRGRREPLVLSYGMDYKPLQVSPADAAFLDSMRFTATQIANVWGVPPELVGGTVGDSMTYSSVAARMIDLQQTAAQPLVSRLEAAWSTMVPPGDQVRVNMDARLRATPRERMETHKIAIDAGIETVDEARSIEDRPPLASSSGMSSRDLAEALQKIYLAVGKVISADEAREILNREGAGLSPHFDGGTDGA